MYTVINSRSDWQKPRPILVIHVTVAGWGVDQAEKLRASLALRLRLDSVMGFKLIPTVALLLAPGPGAGRARARGRTKRA